MPPASTQPRTPLSAQVYERLLGDILSGRLAPGDATPSERVLHQELGVNRQAVREAVKRLEQAGLVEVRHGGATRVRDFRRSAGLDLFPALVVELAADSAPMAAQVAEMRRAIGTDAAVRFVQRAPAQLRDGLAAFAAALPADATGDDGRRAAYAALWETIVDGSLNLPYRLAYNSLMAALAAIGEPALLPFDGETRDAAGQRALLDALAAGDAEAARAAADALLSQGLRACAG